MKKIVAHQKIKGTTADDVFLAVEKVMRDAGYKDVLKGESIFIKVNLMSDKLVPGLCTSWWVTEGILKVIRPIFKKIYIGDADLATTKQVENAAKVWGILELCKKYDAKFINISKQPCIKVPIDNPNLKEIFVPKILTCVDTIITVPVMKTHYLTEMTCALKNQWGCIPRFRHNLHPIAHEIIPEINKVLKIKFVVTDATICIEGNGPRIGTPRVENSIFASTDLVAMDSSAADFMGLDKKKIGYLNNAEKIGVGSMDYGILGYPIENRHFKAAIIKKQPIVYIEMFLRKIPIIDYIIFKTPIFHIFAWLVTKYNTFIWHNNVGKKSAKKIIEEHPLYRLEFNKLMKLEKNR